MTTAGPMTAAQSDALKAVAELVQELLDRARQLVRDGASPLEATDRVIREAKDPRAVVAAAYLSLFAAVDQAGPAPPQTRSN